MALDRLTKIDGGGISTTSDYRVGVITATKFVGPFDGTGGNFSGVVTATNGVFSGNISAVDGNFSGNVTIGGTLTYEDVTNIDAIGIITARAGINVSGGTITGDGSGLTGLPAGAPVGGASTNTVFFENDNSVDVSYTISTDKNAMAAGPIAIKAGVTVTVPSGSFLTIV